MSEFPTRQYQYAAAASLKHAPAFSGGSLFRFLLGRDAQPVVIDPARSTDGPRDPFWTEVLAIGGRPLTLDAVLGALPVAWSERKSFVVGDGGQIPWRPATKDVVRSLRLVVTCGRPTELPSVLISTALRSSDPNAFLQVIGWDDARPAHQFYERRGSAWIWAGSSWDALEDDTRGRGPFDSHVNGCLNMKELEEPWLHWHSMSAPIADDVLAPDDPFRSRSEWTGRSLAHELERNVVRPGITRWIERRIRGTTAGGTTGSFLKLFRHLTHTTTVNLATSPHESSSEGRPIGLPLDFLVDRVALFDILGIDPDITVPAVSSEIYRATLRRFESKLTDGTFAIDGDTHFAFAVPVRAFEDHEVLRALVTRRFISPRFAAALTMVDFPNPVFSTRRESLLAYAPDVALEADADAFEAAFVDRVRRGRGNVEGTAEHELLSNLAISEDAWRAAYAARIERTFAAIGACFQSQEGFAELFRLAESRRREFRRRPLAEFALTLATTNIAPDAPFLEMTEAGAVRTK